MIWPQLTFQPPFTLSLPFPWNFLDSVLSDPLQALTGLCSAAISAQNALFEAPPTLPDSTVCEYNSTFCGLNVLSPNSYVEALISNVVAIGGVAFDKQLCHESGALMNGVSDLPRREERGTLSLPCEDKQEGGWLQCRKRALPKNWTSQHFILDVPAFRTARNKFLLFKPPSLCYSITAA